MKKIIVIGSPGAGKSTFARKLREKTGIPLYYLDMLWHKPDRTNVSQEEFDAGLDSILCQDEWIIDGNYLRTLERRLKACDTVFFLDYPLEVCLSGAASRSGKKRGDMTWVVEGCDEEFRQWIIDFPRDQLPFIDKKLEQYRSKREIILFKSRQEAEYYLKNEEV